MLATAPVVRPLPEVLVELRSKGLRRGVTDASVPREPPISTGFAELDDALRTDGLPRGSCTLLDADRGSGATTLALHTLAAAQRGGGLAAYVDVAGSFDPATAARLGVRLEWLLVVRPATIDEAVEISGWLARSRLIDAFVLDLVGARRPVVAAATSAAARSLDRLAQVLARTSATGILLTGRADREAGFQVAGVRIALERRAWLAIGRDLVGQRVAATVTRHRWAVPGGRAELDLWFAEGRRIDPMVARRAETRELPPSVVERTADRVRVLTA
ncbi:MAG: hypothetical protein ABR509_07040 [Candidatus Limnocylindria bacterium]